MGYVDLYATKYAYVDALGADDSHSNALQPVRGNGKLLLRFPALDDSLKFRSITTALYFHVSGRGYSYIKRQTVLPEDFDAETVTYDTIPQSADASEYALNKKVGVSWNTFDGQQGSISHGAAEARDSVVKRTCILDNFLIENYPTYPSSLSFSTPLASGSARPYLRVNYSDADVGVYNVTVNSATNMNPHKALTFTWSYSVPADTAEPLAVTGETFFWKTSEESSYHSIAVSPGARQAVVPAETFPGASTIQYFVRVTCNSGVSADSDVMSTSTAAPAVGISLTAPDRTVEIYNEVIKFRWTVTGQSGYGFAKTELRYRRNGGEWTSLAEVQAPATEYDAPANTFQAGSIEWSARAYNADDVASDWASMSFVAFGSPAAPAVSVDAVPFATISWQSTEQEAYQLELDGELLGTFFGYGRQYKLQTPLEDGSHVARVRVQNAYGLWSQYGEVSFSITNDPGGEIALDGTFAVDAALFWISADLTADFLIFRDGALIGHTAGDRFTDRFVLGAHSYYVINRLPSGNYSRSNTVKGKMCTRRPLIALLSGGEWLPLRYSERSMTQQSFTWQKTHSLRHIAGATFPVLEISPYEDLSGAYDAAFLCPQDAERFYRLLGQVVVLKSKGGKVLIGAITSISEIVNTFYQACQFTLEQIQWEDYVDDSNG